MVDRVDRKITRRAASRVLGSAALLAATGGLGLAAALTEKRVSTSQSMTPPNGETTTTVKETIKISPNPTPSAVCAYPLTPGFYNLLTPTAEFIKQRAFSSAFSSDNLSPTRHFVATTNQQVKVADELAPEAGYQTLFDFAPTSKDIGGGKIDQIIDLAASPNGVDLIAVGYKQIQPQALILKSDRVGRGVLEAQLPKTEGIIWAARSLEPDNYLVELLVNGIEGDLAVIDNFGHFRPLIGSISRGLKDVQMVPNRYQEAVAISLGGDLIDPNSFPRGYVINRFLTGTGELLDTNFKRGDWDQLVDIKVELDNQAQPHEVYGLTPEGYIYHRREWSMFPNTNVINFPEMLNVSLANNFGIAGDNLVYALNTTQDRVWVAGVSIVGSSNNFRVQNSTDLKERNIKKIQGGLNSVDFYHFLASFHKEGGNFTSHLTFFEKGLSTNVSRGIKFENYYRGNYGVQVNLFNKGLSFVPTDSRGNPSCDRLVLYPNKGLSYKSTILYLQQGN